MNDGGPAFPVPLAKGWDGMSLRDFFAAAALTGIYASGPKGMDADDVDRIPLKDWAKCAYAQADSMLKRREKKP